MFMAVLTVNLGRVWLDPGWGGSIAATWRAVQWFSPPKKKKNHPERHIHPNMTTTITYLQFLFGKTKNQHDGEKRLNFSPSRNPKHLKKKLSRL